MTGSRAVAEALRQMIDGQDYTPLERLIEDLAPEQAARKPTGSPYSIATLAWHTWFWVNAWTTIIRGSGDPFQGQDPDATWPEIASEDWPMTRSRLLEALLVAQGLAASEDVDRRTWQEETVGGNLLQIAIHTAYHIGQITLVRQELGLWPPKKGE